MSLDDRALVACAAAVWKCRTELEKNLAAFVRRGQGVECEREIREFEYAEVQIEMELALRHLPNVT